LPPTFYHLSRILTRDYFFLFLLCLSQSPLLIILCVCVCVARYRAERKRERQHSSAQDEGRRLRSFTLRSTAPSPPSLSTQRQNKQNGASSFRVTARSPPDNNSNLRFTVITTEKKNKQKKKSRELKEREREAVRRTSRLTMQKDAVDVAVLHCQASAL
jgi:hypothetical protein